MENPNVIALADQLFQRDYKGSKPSQNPLLFQGYVDHIKNLMTMPVVPFAVGKQMPGDVDMAKHYEAILAGTVPSLASFESKLKQAASGPAGLPMTLDPMTQLPIKDKTDVDNTSATVIETDNAKAEMLAGVVKPGVFDPEPGFVPAPGMFTPATPAHPMPKPYSPDVTAKSEDVAKGSSEAKADNVAGKSASEKK